PILSPLPYTTLFRSAGAVRRGASLEHLRARAGAAAVVARGPRGGRGGGLRRGQLPAGPRGPGRVSRVPPWTLTAGARGRKRCSPDRKSTRLNSSHEW